MLRDMGSSDRRRVYWGGPSTLRQGTQRDFLRHSWGASGLIGQERPLSGDRV
jgi:hypothetical protein